WPGSWAAIHGVAARIETGAEGAAVVGSLLLLDRQRTAVLNQHGMRLLRVGGVGSTADRPAQHRAGERRGSCVPRPGNGRADEGAGDGADRRVGTRGRAGVDDHALVRRHAPRARIKAGLRARPRAALVMIAVLLLGRLTVQRIGIHLDRWRRG